MLNKRKNKPKPQEWQLKKWIIFVGLPGCGKSTLGLALSKLINVPFYDADIEITRASNMEIADIFSTYGEAEFRRMEEQVIARLLAGPPAILALGGGAYENPNTRQIIKEKAFSVWLKVDHETILARIAQRSGRPMFDNSNNPKQLLGELAQKREPNFAKTDIQFIPPDAPITTVARALNNVLRKFSLFRRI